MLDPTSIATLSLATYLNIVLKTFDSDRLGKLLKDEKLYGNLEGASLQLEQLLQDVKLNPKRYMHFSVFGKKPNNFDAEENQEDDNGLNLNTQEN